jgi:TetR/AcrR family transcriptional regulator, transcriptional repressor for nem operon
MLMRKSRAETAETRQRIVKAASAEFRRNGIVKTGLTELMAAAGLTHGGFYKHFMSKDQVVEESLLWASDTLTDHIQSTLVGTVGSMAFNAAIDEYLSIHHRDNPADGCPYVALGSELSRASERVRDAATSSLMRFVELIATQLKDMTPTAARKEALAVVSTMVGAMTLARIVNDPELSASILHEARRHLAR